MKAWKVFTKEDDKLFSFHKSSGKCQEWVIEYKVGEKNYPKPGTGGIFCFKTKRNALDFSGCDPDLVILKVEIEVSEIPITHVARGYIDVKPFWDAVLETAKKGNNNSSEYYASFPLPKGTILAKSLIILEE